MFTGTPVVQQVTDNLCRITGILLDEDASGVIVLAPFTSPPAGAIVLPKAFKPETTSRGAEAQLVSLQDSVSTLTNLAGAAAGAAPISIVKTGTTPQTFEMTFTNSTGSNTPLLEIYVRFN